ncbi:hypothetical protein ABIA32_000869 [Streptacidiphilus sp. MAP12-20]|uniref:hypothetical protein n=1 Tax=Streptacidiphilus sp. MAP12-20 TaxID=3156299 RepID=UPI003515BB31
MNKKRIAQLLGVTASITTLMLATPGSAYADGIDIGWHSRATGHCLFWARNADGTFDLSNDAICWGTPDQGGGWDDSQNNVSAQTGAYWTEKPHGSNGTVCLASNGQGQAYLENCLQPANWNEQWEEQWVGNGYNLVNRWSHWCLDGNGSGQMYTNPCQSGNNYQVWY